jgi:hypothetical protein
MTQRRTMGDVIDQALARNVEIPDSIADVMWEPWSCPDCGWRGLIIELGNRIDLLKHRTPRLTVVEGGRR